MIPSAGGAAMAAWISVSRLGAATPLAPPRHFRNAPSLTIQRRTGQYAPTIVINASRHRFAPIRPCTFSLPGHEQRG